MATTLASGAGVAVRVNQNEAFSQTTPSYTQVTGLSSIGQSAIATFEEYAKVMAPGVVQIEAQAIRYQVGLYRAIVNTINKNTQDFNKTWSILLNIFNDNKKGAFGERYLYRYMANITLSADQRSAFLRLTTLMRETAPAQGRSAVLKLIDMKRALEKDLTADGRQRILNYYNQFQRQ